MELIGAIELGGTKVIAAVGTDPLAPLRRVKVLTQRPDITLGAVAEFFTLAERDLGPLAAIGIAAFGPIDIRPQSPDRGLVGPTSKPGWEGTNIIALLKRPRHLLALDTDVNAAALAESRWGAARGLETTAYLTVGTGIGGGLVIGGKTVRGAMHPEIGHLRIKQHPADAYRSRCPFHDDCAEGLASGGAIMDRFGCTLEDLGADHPFRAIFADYLGQLCAALVLVFSPEKIVIGGGVMADASLYQAIDAAMRTWLGGYSEPPLTGDPLIVPPALGDSSGLTGAFALARDLLTSADSRR